jgi:hypothetical protein
MRFNSNPGLDYGASNPRPNDIKGYSQSTRTCVLGQRRSNPPRRRKTVDKSWDFPTLRPWNKQDSLMVDTQLALRDRRASQGGAG